MKPLIRHSLVAFFAFFPAGCDQGAAPEPPAPKPRATLSIAIGHTSANEVELPSGTSLTTLVPVVSAVELHTCPATASVRTNRADKWAGNGVEILRFIVPEAHAHVPTSSTRLGDPAASDLLDGRDASRVIGEVAAPLERFCSAWIIFAPADDDVLNVTPISDEELLGKTLVARTADGVLYSTDQVRSVEVELADPNKGGPLQLDTPGSGPMLLFDLEPGRIEATDAESDDVAERLLAAIEVSMRRFDVPAEPAEPSSEEPPAREEEP